MAKELQAMKIEQAVTIIKVSDYLDYKKYFSDLYACMKENNTKYTYLRFAEDLGFNATTAAHQIVRGHRPLSAKNAERVVKALKLTGKEKKYFMSLIDFNNAKSVKSREERFETLVSLKQQTLKEPEEKENLQFYAEWQHPVIREMLGVQEYAANPESIAQDMIPHIDKDKVQESIALLESLGVIAKDPKTAKYELTNRRFATGPRVKGMAVASYHRQMINLAMDSLATTKGKERDISAITVSVDAAGFQKLKAMIHAFQLEILAEAEKTENPDSVVQLNLQLFPLSKPNGGKD